MRCRVKAVSIPSTYVTTDGFPSTSPGKFTLGLGPCGKVVDSLEVSFEGAFVTVYQGHSDGTVKAFAYPNHLLTGRVVMEDLD